MIKLKEQFIKNVILMMIIATLVSSCSHEINLPITAYPEEALTWCGPATGQTIMHSYPASSCYKPQEDVWDSILTFKTETMWDTDPVGLKQSMMEMCPPIGSWQIVDKTDSSALMYDVAYNMERYRYPVAAVLNTAPHNSYTPHAEHWVTIFRVITDKDPTTNTSVNLFAIEIYDPKPLSLGGSAVRRFFSGTGWYSEFSRVTKTGSAYFNKFVTIIEPPENPGIVRAPVEITSGPIIKPEEALKQAKKWIRVYQLKNRESFLKNKPLRPGKPMLVNPKKKAYYLIPFYDDQQSSLCSVAMQINAYDGSMREVGSFSPTHYLNQDEVISIALADLKIQNYDNVEVKLTAPDSYDFNKYFPIHEVRIDNKLIYVNKEGATFNQIKFPQLIQFERKNE